jgi:GNAT superfamily N-acetyltransferase
MLIFRPVNLSTDLPVMARLFSTTRPEPVTVEQIRDWWQPRKDEIRLTIMALNGQGQIIGLSDVQRDTWMRPGHFWLNVIVAPKWQNQGIGAQLFKDGAVFARSKGASHLESNVRENDPGSLRFAEQRGYITEHHSFESSLDLASFDESRFTGVNDRVSAAGFRFFSLADSGPLTETSKHKLYKLNRSTALDNPGNDRTFPTFDGFSKNVFEASWFRADTQLLAAQDDDWVGLSAIAIYPEENYAYNAFTGVLLEYRGKGLALVLKLHAIQLARKLGATYIRTNNDSQNAPMLAVNRKLGYQSEPGIYHLLSSLE